LLDNYLIPKPNLSRYDWPQYFKPINKEDLPLTLLIEDPSLKDDIINEFKKYKTLPAYYHLTKVLESLKNEDPKFFFSKLSTFSNAMTDLYYDDEIYKRPREFAQIIFGKNMNTIEDIMEAVKKQFVSAFNVYYERHENEFPTVNEKGELVPPGQQPVQESVFDRYEKAFDELYSESSKTRLNKASERKKKHSSDKKVPKKFLKNYKGYKVYIVHGDYIRDKIDIDFVGGGNPSRYQYVPNGEIWVENLDDDKDDIQAFIKHEYVECERMKNKKETYNKAHDEASKEEKKLRKKQDLEEKNDLMNKTDPGHTFKGQSHFYSNDQEEEEMEEGRKLGKPSSETSLRDWFKRKGAPGKKGGWVDCNTCRDGKCKPCGRQGGEKRSKYPRCRPTPSQCKGYKRRGDNLQKEGP
jgi:hypothetical protein